MVRGRVGVRIRVRVRVPYAYLFDTIFGPNSSK